MRNKIITEFIWLITLLLISTAAEYAIIEFFDLHPVLSVKIQGLIGLLVIAYGIRMVARLWEINKGQESKKNEKNQVSRD